MIGWSIVVPTVGGAFLGLWLDRLAPQSFSWTIALILGGVAMGAMIAWAWMDKEEQMISYELIDWQYVLDWPGPGRYACQIRCISQAWHWACAWHLQKDKPAVPAFHQRRRSHCASALAGKLDSLTGIGCPHRFCAGVPRDALHHYRSGTSIRKTGACAVELTPDASIAFSIGPVAINDTILFTWVVMAILTGVSMLVTRNLRPTSHQNGGARRWKSSSAASRGRSKK